MPKRIATPPPGEDEPRYLTVVHPYAINGTCNMELPKDRQDFARWVACCIDKDAFFAIFHKPSSRGMVIIEISRDYPHFDKVLGEHRWSEFLQGPTKEEKGRVTQVFYCTFNTGRLVQKNGWKRIDVEETWFKGLSPKNRHIKFPYPPTHFCDVPVEDRTNYPLCRPLPGAVKTPPVEVIAAPQPVVGSAAWIHTKKGGPSPAPIATQSRPGAPSAWGQGAPKATATAKPNPTANGSVKKVVGVPQRPDTGVRRPAVGGGPVVVKTSNVWRNTGKKGPVATNWDESAPISREGTPVSRTVSPSTASTAPPGTTTQKNGATSHPTHLPGLAVPGKATSEAGSGLDRTTGWDSTGNSTSSPDSDSGPDLTTATESDNPYAVHINFSGSMEEEFHGMGIRAIEDEDELRELDSIAPGAWDGPTWDATWAAAGWDDEALDAEDHWKKDQEAIGQPVLCNAHGIICKKGICAEYANQLRLQKRAEEAEKRKAAAADKGKKGARGKGQGAGKKRDERRDNGARNENATQNNPFRGPGAPVKTNWRGAPRAIVSADTIEKRETTKVPSDDEWDNPSDIEPNAAAVVSAGPTDAASNASWDVSENSFDPWAVTAQRRPAAKAGRSDAKPQGQGKKKTKTASDDWAEEVEAEFAARNNADMFTAVSSKRGGGAKRGTSSTTSWGSSAAKTSTSGWGNVPDMPW